MEFAVDDRTPGAGRRRDQPPQALEKSGFRYLLSLSPPGLTIRLASPFWSPRSVVTGTCSETSRGRQP
ncbi:hypothetical protein HYQ46_005359 [Verticillium longisporum]|nr:hypothetical protein HYQ46_005359 [Verticillium longisporum]